MFWLRNDFFCFTKGLEVTMMQNMLYFTIYILDLIVEHSGSANRHEITDPSVNIFKHL